MGKAGIGGRHTDKDLCGRETGQNDEWEVGVGRRGGNQDVHPLTGSLEGTTVSVEDGLGTGSVSRESPCLLVVTLAHEFVVMWGASSLSPTSVQRGSPVYHTEKFMG